MISRLPRNLDLHEMRTQLWSTSLDCDTTDSGMQLFGGNRTGCLQRYRMPYIQEYSAMYRRPIGPNRVVCVEQVQSLR